MAKLKVVQCWDDAPYNDLRLVEILRKYNAKATFNINTGLLVEQRRKPFWFDYKNPDYSVGYFNNFYPGKLTLKDIKEVYDGFEIASHCHMHENASTMPHAEWIKKAVQAREILEDIVQRPCRGFAWPCGDYTPETCAELRKAGFAYGRTTKYIDFVTDNEDAMALHTNCHFMNYQFFQKYEKAKECGVFYFWGHSYEMLDYDKYWDLLEEKIAYISNDPDAEWCNVIDIAPLCDGKNK